MGSSSYSHDDYTARVNYRHAHAIPTFSYDADVRSGKVASKVSDRLNPFGKTRESRDSEEHPVTIPIGVIMDTTGSMGSVPVTLEARLPKLMGSFLDDKASGKDYLGGAYPAILVGAVDDYEAMGYDGNGALQVGQFESGIEIDQDLESIWITGRGGGTYEESYDLATYFFARHTVHDHWEKRGRKGYLFIIGDEKPYPYVSAHQVKDIIGDNLQSNIPFEEILREAKERYHVFFIIPNLTSHYNDPALHKRWTELLGQQNVILLEDPNKVCETIVSAVAICEENVGVDDLLKDGVMDGTTALALKKLSDSASGGLKKYSTSTGNLPVPTGDDDALLV